MPEENWKKIAVLELPNFNCKCGGMATRGRAQDHFIIFFCSLRVAVTFQYSIGTRLEVWNKGAGVFMSNMFQIRVWSNHYLKSRLSGFVLSQPIWIDSVVEVVCEPTTIVVRYFCLEDIFFFDLSLRIPVMCNVERPLTSVTVLYLTEMLHLLADLTH